MGKIPLPKTKFNLCAYIILPLLGRVLCDTKDDGFINAYVSVGDNSISIHDEDLDKLKGSYTFVAIFKYNKPRHDCHFDITKCVEDDGSVSYMYEYTIPYDHQADVVAFLKGDWSNFSDNAIRKIKEYNKRTHRRNKSLALERLIQFICDPDIRIMYEVGFKCKQDEIFDKPDFPIEYYIK